MAMSLYFYLTLIFTIFINVTTESGTITQNIDGDDHETFEFLLVSGWQVRSFVLYTIVSLRTSEFIEYWGDNHFCSGFIISSKTVVTAAHCVVSRQGIKIHPQQVRVVAGLINRLDEPQHGNDVGVASITIYPGYKRYLVHDIAILRLKSPLLNAVIMRDAKIMEDFDNINNCITMGWGQLYPDGPYANELFYTAVDILPTEECLQQNQSIKNSIHLCGFSRHPDADLCWGDTGAPLICNNHLVGIFGGPLKCTGDRLLKFTNVMHYATWINTVKVGKLERDLDTTLFVSIFVGILLSLFLVFFSVCNLN